MEGSVPASEAEPGTLQATLAATPGNSLVLTVQSVIALKFEKTKHAMGELNAYMSGWTTVAIQIAIYRRYNKISVVYISEILYEEAERYVNEGYMTKTANF